MTTDHDHETECLGSITSHTPCAGEVTLQPTYPPRWRNNGTMVMFPRCEAHYDEYLAECEAREQREQEARERMFCRHGTFIGDPYGADYLCMACEMGE